MIPSAYPALLPCPTVAVVRPAERRLPSDLAGPKQFRGLQRDYLADERVEWTLTQEQAAAFDSWWRDDLVQGGKWFLSDWPSPQGAGLVRRFGSAPKWVYIHGGTNRRMWRVSAECEVRGRGVAPQTSGGFKIGYAGSGYSAAIDLPPGLPVVEFTVEALVWWNVLADMDSDNIFWLYDTQHNLTHNWFLGFNGSGGTLSLRSGYTNTSVGSVPKGSTVHVVLVVYSDSSAAVYVDRLRAWEGYVLSPVSSERLRLVAGHRPEDYPELPREYTVRKTLLSFTAKYAGPTISTHYG